MDGSETAESPAARQLAWLRFGMFCDTLRERLREIPVLSIELARGGSDGPAGFERLTIRAGPVVRCFAWPKIAALDSSRIELLAGHVSRGILRELAGGLDERERP